jgi:hypothetical protein
VREYRKGNGTDLETCSCYCNEFREENPKLSLRRFALKICDKDGKNISFLSLKSIGGAACKILVVEDRIGLETYPHKGRNDDGCVGGLGVGRGCKLKTNFFSLWLPSVIKDIFIHAS